MRTTTTRPDSTARSHDRQHRSARTAIVLIALVLAATACRSPRTILETHPPITCSVYDADDLLETASVRVDADPETIEIGEFTFRVEYRSSEHDRKLKTTVERTSGEILEQVSYLVPRRMAFRNQFGFDRRALTGEHDILPAQSIGLRWSCGVQQGERSVSVP